MRGQDTIVINESPTPYVNNTGYNNNDGYNNNNGYNNGYNPNQQMAYMGQPVYSNQEQARAYN